MTVYEYHISFHWYAEDREGFGSCTTTTNKPLATTDDIVMLQDWVATEVVIPKKASLWGWKNKPVIVPIQILLLNVDGKSPVVTG